jgi:hypothetical protein
MADPDDEIEDEYKLTQDTEAIKKKIMSEKDEDTTPDFLKVVKTPNHESLQESEGIS